MTTYRFSMPVAALCLTLGAPVLTTAQASGRGPGRGNGTGPIVEAPVLPLPDEQAKTLRFMREEEKLARDVYQAMYEKWQLSVFRNITASENTHFEAVGTLLTRYNVSDPAAGLAAGVYSDPTLTQLYQQLMAKGSASVEDALEVGVLIEKTDIADLEKGIAGTDRADIKRVYTNLMNASYSHQEAFETNLELACSLAQK
jgi:hypothetical protein